ncbi:MAG: 5'-nucleotidase C-terminal domain-containing protein [Chloroflexi bacterium]|nr:5'-nucleotidase C-terminal domain-containing protein [Chloroflexota bacterium]
MRRSLLAWLVLLALALGVVVAGCQAPFGPEPTATAMPPAATVSPTPPKTETIAILHTNDMHGYLEPELIRVGEKSFESGGAANIAGHIEAFRKEYGGKVLVLDGGDTWQGTFVSNKSRGAAVTEMMNISGYDAQALGNHDFDWGQEVLKERAAQAKFPFLAANVVEESSGKVFSGAKPYVVKSVGSVKVAVLGLGYPGTPAISKAANVRGLRFLPGPETAAQYIPALRKEADLVVVLSHLGLGDDEKLAASVEGIDVIVGGHSHTEIRNTKRVGNTLIVQAGSKAKFLGRLELVYDKEARKITRYTTSDEMLSVVSGKIAPDAQVAALVTKYAKEAQAIMDRPLGETLVDLEQGYAGEFPLGNLIVDAMRSVDAGYGKVADIAMHNNAGVRSSISKGPITYGQLYKVLPFDNVLTAMDLTGAQIRIILEKAVAGRPGNMLVSGMTYTFDQSQPEGARIKVALVGGKPLDPKRVYRVMTIDYLAGGGDGQVEFKNGSNLTYGDPTVDVVAEYIQRHSPVSPKVEGRIVGR